MKRFLCMLLLTLLLLCQAPLDAPAAAGEASDRLLVCGTAALPFTGGGVSFEARIGDERFPFTDAEDAFLRVTLTVSGADAKNNMLYAGETPLGALVNGENRFDVPKSAVSDGSLLLRVLLSAGSDALFDETKPYGSYNLDDIVIESAAFAYADGTEAAPVRTLLYLPVQGQAGVTELESGQAAGIAVGDGWDASTGLGGSTPQTPVCVGFLLTPDLGRSTAVCTADTTRLPDGPADAVLYDSATGEPAGETLELYVCNTAPDVTFPLESGGRLPAGEALTLTVGDNAWGLKTAAVYVNDTLLQSVQAAGEVTIKAAALRTGANRVRVSTEDTAGNTAEHFLLFTVSETPDYVFRAEGAGAAFALDGVEGTLYGAVKAKNINMYQNRLGVFGYDALRLSTETLVPFADRASIVTEAVGNSLPYQSFVVSVQDSAGTAAVSYRGETGNGDDILLKVYNHRENRWDTLYTAASGEQVTFLADLVTYSEDGKMRVTAMPATVANGSDTMLWNTDTQYYSRYEDLNFLYESVVRYAAEAYAAGEIGYALHTGDLVDQTDSAETARKQYAFASAMQKMLDDAGVPNGVVAGNHDIRHTSADYSYYREYFNEARYADMPCYGGGLDDNASHFDLVSIGGYDFVILYLGCYLENDPATLAWANEVLRTYSGRNAVIATHEYLNKHAQWSGDRAEVIWNELVVPNDNVKLILCGHNEGAADRLRQVGDSDRYVLELLADYQFAELGEGPQHVENGMTCDGEGFVRLLRFTRGGQLLVSTYSPAYDKWNYYPEYVDSLVYDLDLIETPLSIRTTDFAVGLDIFPMEASDNRTYDTLFAGFTYGGRDFYTPLLLKDSEELLYAVPEDGNDYTEQSLRYGEAWPAGVLPSLRFGGENTLPASDSYSSAFSLLPTADGLPVLSSGGPDFDASFSDSGGYVQTLTGGALWVTTLHNVQAPAFGESTDLFFGVTAAKNACWNLTLYTRKGKTLNFSQGLYTAFGYAGYDVPSDISGTWSGYIPLDGLVDADDAVTRVAFTSAATGEAIVFDYLFLARAEGARYAFTAGDAVREVRVAEGRVLYAPDDPSLPGFTFDGWIDETGAAVTFPMIAGPEGGRFTAVFTAQEAVPRAEALYEEAALAPITGSTNAAADPSADVGGDAWYLLLLLLPLALLIWAAVRKKKKE